MKGYLEYLRQVIGGLGRWWMAIAIVLGVVSTACDVDLTPNTEPACTPQCLPGNACEDDGCGGICPCPGSMVCDDNGVCVEQNDCTLECDSFPTPWVCGTICGNDCGTCPANQMCVSGVCECRPQCDGTQCGADGCGGTCECATGTVCDTETNQCVDCSPDDPCGDRECGTYCGQVCGECPTDNYTCVQGQCICEPLECDGTRCDDGCGGTCPCGENLECNADGECVDACDDTCAGAG